jgi:hypothetical protein
MGQITRSSLILRGLIFLALCGGAFAFEVVGEPNIQTDLALQQFDETIDPDQRGRARQMEAINRSKHWIMLMPTIGFFVLFGPMIYRKVNELDLTDDSE